MDIAILAELLRETSERHDHYEKTHAEHHWWDWYPPYLNARQNGNNPEEAVAVPTVIWTTSFMFRHDESLSILNYMKTHHVLSFLCGAAGMLGFSALSGSRSLESYKSDCQNSEVRIRS